MSQARRCPFWFQEVAFTLSCSLGAHLRFLTSQEPGVRIPATPAAVGPVPDHPGQPSSVKWAAQNQPPRNQTAMGASSKCWRICNGLGAHAHPEIFVSRAKAGPWLRPLLIPPTPGFRADMGFVPLRPGLELGWRQNMGGKVVPDPPSPCHCQEQRQRRRRLTRLGREDRKRSPQDEWPLSLGFSAVPGMRRGRLLGLG